MMKGTMDETILQLQKKKLVLLEMTIRSQRDVCVSEQLTMDDILLLFDGMREINAGLTLVFCQL